MSLITCSELSKTFQVAEKKPGLKGSFEHFLNRKSLAVKAVDSVSFSIDEGEIVGFIGSNGAGKTTTLKMLCGLLQPTSGYLSIAGFSPFQRRKQYLQRITLVMGQKQQLIWDLPPLDSLRVNAAVYGLSKRLADKRIDELALSLGIK